MNVKLFAGAFAFLTILTGCGPASASHESRVPLRLNELAITVGTTPRNCLLTDKTGGFVVGEIAPPSGQTKVTWSIAGEMLLNNFKLQVN